MDLFVINRYGEDESQVDEEENLKNILSKVESRKQTLKRNREVQAQSEPIQKTNDHEDVIDQYHEEVTDSHHEEVIDQPIVKKAKKDVADIDGFTILGGEQFGNKNKVKRVLPKWLANPNVISVDLQNLSKKVSSLKILDKGLRKQLKENGIEYLFPVQAEVIPWLIQSKKDSCVLFPRDICVSAPTGSGKTLAFVLPVVHALKNYTVKKIRALVILPTQDLAIQVFKTFKKYTEGSNLDVICITGKTPMESEQKLLVYNSATFGYLSKVDILVCTAGRLVDHLKLTPGLNLKELEYLIIDEADRVLDTIQNDWLYHLEKHIKQDNLTKCLKTLSIGALKTRRAPQKLLFSATLSQDPEKLQKLSLFQPLLFTSIVETEESLEKSTLNTDTFIGKYTTPKELSEKFIISSVDLKPLVLYEFIKSEKLTKTLIFMHSVETTHRLAILLKSLFGEGFKVEEISSNLDIQSKNLLIDKFIKGEIDILVCTDTLARGIDLPGVQCVISYSSPKYLKSYIHRAGRTARAGEPGTAVTLLQKGEVKKFMQMLQKGHKTNLEEIKICEDSLELLGEMYKEALGELKKLVSEEEVQEIVKMKTAKRNSVKQKRKLNKE